jgi:hypothetical protein
MIYDLIKLSALPPKDPIDWLAACPHSYLIVRSDKNDPQKNGQLVLQTLITEWETHG